MADAGLMIFFILGSFSIYILMLRVTYKKGQASVQWKLDLQTASNKDLEKKLKEACGPTSYWSYPKYTIDMDEMRSIYEYGGKLFLTGEKMGSGVYTSRLHRSEADAEWFIKSLVSTSSRDIFEIELKFIKRIDK